MPDNVTIYRSGDAIKFSLTELYVSEPRFNRKRGGVIHTVIKIENIQFQQAHQ